MYRILGTMLLVVGLIVAARSVEAQIKGKGVTPAPAMRMAAPATATATEAATINGDESLLRSVGIATDGPGLLTYFHLRSRGEANPKRLAVLIEQLDDSSSLVAQKASGELAAIGAPAIPALRRAVKDLDRQQMVRRAQQCLQALESHPGQLSCAAARRIGELRPNGAAAALLTFLPEAEDDGVIEEIRLALTAIGRTGSVSCRVALLKTLEDDSPLRRAMAIDILCQSGLTATVREQVPLRKLLHDPKPSVRWHAALVLARAHDAQAVSTLIALLCELPLTQARQVEDYLSELAGEQSPKAPLGNDDAARRKCRDAWATWWRSSEDGNRLLDEFRKRTVTEALRQKCEQLIQQLGDSDFRVREKAQAEVKAMGSLIVPLLRRAARHPDLEIRNRARDCLHTMERDKNLPLPPIAPRLLALRKPAGAAETLLAYVPYAGDDAILAEVQLALNAVAFTDGKPEPAVVRALTDEQGGRRAAAAEALCLGGDRQHLPAIRELLSDRDSTVRLKTALALAGIRERQAVSILIELIGELPSDRAEPAEDYLQRLAGEHAPENLPSSDDDGSRKKRRQAWAAWWKVHGERTTLVDRYPPAAAVRYLGYVLLVINNTGQIVELGRDRKVRWQMNGLMDPRDVQVLGNDRLLIVEGNARRVSERNRRGDITWQKGLPNNSFPLSAQRLRNGHTFITCTNKLLEVDRGGKEVYSINRPQNDAIAARRMRDGQIVLVSSMRQCLRLDTTGKQLQSFPLQMVWQSGVNILPNGHVIVPATWINRVTEYDATGKTVWEATANQPSSATRLRNGNVLIAPQQWPAKVIEMDASGKQLSEFVTPNFVYRIRTR